MLKMKLEADGEVEVRLKGLLQKEEYKLRGAQQLAK